jgi:hypothetical protein
MARRLACRGIFRPLRKDSFRGGLRASQAMELTTLCLPRARRVAVPPALPFIASTRTMAAAAE